MKNLHLPNRNFSWSLDLARVIALALIVLHHSTQPVTGWLEWNLGRKISMIIGHGWVGVDLFFVLSGFLLSTQLINVAKSGADERIGSLFNFYARRILRTWPGYFLILALIYFVLPTVNVGDQAHSTYISNFSWHNLVFLSNYNLVENALDVSWSLCLEEQFYLLIPVIYLLFGAFGAKARTRIGLLISAFIAATVARSYVYFTTHSLVPGNYDQFWQFYANLFLHPEGFIAGLLLGEIGIDQFLAPKYRKFVCAFLLVGLPLIYFYGWNAISAVSVIALLPFLSIYFLFFIWDVRFWKGKRFTNVFHFFSKRTYSIYLTHSISNQLIRPYLVTFPPVVSWTVGLVVAILSGCVFYLIAEAPFEKIRERLRRHRYTEQAC